MAVLGDQHVVQSGDCQPVHLINVAAACTGTKSLGPGFRSVVWVQGCPFHCPGCIAPDWIPIQPARLVSSEELVEELLFDHRVTGLTISGGEPMLQASAIARLARLARGIRDIDIICFTGFSLQQLQYDPPGPGTAELLDEVDVLIDGPYIQRLNDNVGLRGSRNQNIHYFSDRIRPGILETMPRQAEIHLMDGQAMLVGVPPARLGDAYNRAIDRANTLQMRLLNYERV